MRKYLLSKIKRSVIGNAFTPRGNLSVECKVYLGEEWCQYLSESRKAEIKMAIDSKI